MAIPKLKFRGINILSFGAKTLQKKFQKPPKAWLLMCWFQYPLYNPL